MGDYGISELVEMVERRLGRFWSNALFVLLLAATAAFAFSVLNDHAIQPLYRVAVWVLGEDAVSNIPYLLFIESVQIGLTGLIGGVLGLLSAYIYAKRWEKKAKVLAQELREAAEKVSGVHRETGEILAEARRALDEATRARDEAEKLNAAGASTVKKAALIALGEIWERGTHFLNSASSHRILTGEHQIQINQFEDEILGQVNVVSPAETSEFRVLGTYDWTKHPQTLWPAYRGNDDTLLIFSERLRRVKEFRSRHIAALK